MKKIDKLKNEIEVKITDYLIQEFEKDELLNFQNLKWGKFNFYLRTKEIDGVETVRAINCMVDSENSFLLPLTKENDGLFSKKKETLTELGILVDNNYKKIELIKANKEFSQLLNSMPEEDRVQTMRSLKINEILGNV